MTESAVRSDIYAWYGLLGTAGTAFGMVTCGWVIHHFTYSLGWELVDAYGAVFYGYAALGLVKLALVLLLSSKVEAEKKSRKPGQNTAETTPLLAENHNGSGNSSETVEADGNANGAAKKPTAIRQRLRALLPEISRESVGVMVNLCILFSLDSFASGLAPL